MVNYHEISMDIWGSLSHGGSPSHHACFNAKSWSNDLDDLGIIPWIGHLHNCLKYTQLCL